MGLTCGERAVRCFLGEEIDRVPFGIELGWYPWWQTVDRWKRESAKPDLDIAGELGYEAGFAIPQTHSGIYPVFEPRIISESDDYLVSSDERGITMRSLKGSVSMPEFVDYPVKTPDDWEQIKNERLRIDNAGRVHEDWDTFRSRLRETGEAVQVGLYPYGVFGTVRDLMGVEEMLVGFYTEPGMIREMMEHLTSLWISVWEKVAREVQIDHIHIWEDMSGKQGSLISPAMIEEFMMPCYDRIVDFGKSVGARIFSVDTDGDCSELIPIMTRHGINMFLPFEVQAGNNILRIREQYPKLGIYGGLDKRALALDRAAIDETVQLASIMIKRGRYVPAFDHLIPPDVPWDSFRYAAEQIRAICMQA